MAGTLQGACLCGGIQYGPTQPGDMGYCHCQRYESEFAPRHFCSHRGSIVDVDPGAGAHFVAAGLMRELDLSPSFHLQVAYKAPWESIGDGAPRFDENPRA